MPKVQIRDVSESTHKVLKMRAAGAGKSLQEYVRALLDEHAETPTVEDVMHRVRQRSGSRTGGDDIDNVLRGDRARH